MAIHSITFCIEHDSTYSRRSQSVVDAIRSLTHSTYWDEPTSFALIESALNSSGLAEAIVRNSDFNDGKDILLVVNLSKKGYTARGPIVYGDLHALMERR